MTDLYPEIEPHERSFLEVDDGNLVYWETCGNPHGKPAVVLYGGPGSGCIPWHRRLFDPSAYRLVLFDQRNCGRSMPHARLLARDEALAELTMRYYRSHGPATIQDFVWWSGLTTADARAGLAMVTSHLLHETIGGQAYWFSPSTPPEQNLSQAAYLLPNYDEYTVGYPDRSAIVDALHTNRLDPRGGLLTQTMVLDG